MASSVPDLNVVETMGAARPADGLDPWSVLDVAPDPIFVLDGIGTIRYVNQACLAVTGWAHDEIVGRSALDFVHPHDRTLTAQSLVTVAGKDAGVLLLLRIATRSGIWRYLEVRGSGTFDTPGVNGLVLIARDVTDRYMLSVDGGSDVLLRALVDNSTSMILLLNLDGTIRSINPAITRTLGFDPDLVRGTDFLDYIHPDDVILVQDAAENLLENHSHTLTVRLMAADGHDELIEGTVTLMATDPVVNGYVITGHISASLRAANERIEYLAQYDPRTGLLNRDAFFSHVEAKGFATTQQGLVLVDVPSMSTVNNVHGRLAGDQILLQIAERVSELASGDDVAASLGGDDVVLAMPNCSPRRLAAVRARLDDYLAEPFEVCGQPLTIEVSSGSVLGHIGATLDELLATASVELLERRRRRSLAGHDPAVSPAETRRRTKEVEEAFAAGQLEPWFQPIVDRHGTVVGAEALIRWNHPLLGVLTPDQFLHLTTLADLDVPLHHHIVDCSLQLASDVRRRLARAFRVNVNATPRLMSEADFVERIFEALHRFGLPADSLCIEITERELLEVNADAIAKLTTLLRGGVAVAIDDFGTGYSSLSHLLELPISTIKIDRRFVAGLGVDPTSDALTTAVINMANSLNLVCVAEGVELPAQRDRLQILGCSHMQGWLFSKAVPAGQFLGAATPATLVG